MNGFVYFMSSTAGRALRMIVGAALIAWGLLTGSTIIAIIGFVPLAAGLFDFCLLAPLFGAPMSGQKVRAMRA